MAFLYPLWKSLPVSVQMDFSGLIKNNPWKIMFLMTVVHFAILSFRGGALYNYYHHFADRGAMFDFVQKLGLVGRGCAQARRSIGDTRLSRPRRARADPANSNVADVFNSIINMLGTGITIVVILLSPPLAKKFGKKAVAVSGFSLSAGVCPGILSTVPNEHDGHGVADGAWGPLSMRPRFR